MPTLTLLGPPQYSEHDCSVTICDSSRNLVTICFPDTYQREEFLTVYKQCNTAHCISVRFAWLNTIAPSSYHAVIPVTATQPTPAARATRGGALGLLRANP